MTVQELLLSLLPLVRQDPNAPVVIQANGWGARKVELFQVTSVPQTTYEPTGRNSAEVHEAKGNVVLLV